MPDVKDFTITDIADASITVNRFRIEGRIVNSVTGEVIADFTGANAVTWPNIFGEFTGAERKEFFMHHILIPYLKWKFNL